MSKMTAKDWETLEKEMPGFRMSSPPVCTALWELDDWRRWIQAGHKAQNKPKSVCIRCHADNVATDERGLCQACTLTAELPGLDLGPPILHLSNQ